MDAWLRDVPPITRSWVILCVLTTVAVVRWFVSVHHGGYILTTSPVPPDSVQQIEMVTPLQLYFSFKSTFTNAQVRELIVAGHITDAGTLSVLEGSHEFLLLWTAVVRALLSSFFLVRPLIVTMIPDGRAEYPSV